MNPPRIGCVKYLNARPLIAGWKGEVVLDHPAALCRKLGCGELDIALVSSVEYLRNPIYKIVDDVAIASCGEVYSVIVAHDRDLEDLPGIELDPASETSVMLLRVLLQERGMSLKALPTAGDLLDPFQGCGRLLIGDTAIRFRQKFGRRFRYLDLGKEWFENTRLPFVYAIWLARPETPDLNSLADQLRARRNENLANLDDLIAREKEFEVNFCERYYRRCLRFRFREEEKEGLRTFHQICIKHGLLPSTEWHLNLI